MRKIVHLDMDAFYAAVEQRENPALRGKPVVVGGSPDKRGVVCASSYEARRFGIHSAMPTYKARQLCPHAVFIAPRISFYSQVSQQIQAVFRRFSDLVEPLSLDEAYLDVTDSLQHYRYGSALAKEIKRCIRQQTALTASAGVSFNKFLAKVASDWRKPDGLTVIPPEKAALFLQKLPVEKFYGIGRVTAAKMRSLGITCGSDILRWSKERLIVEFGKAGGCYFDMARGIDNRPVTPNKESKSIGRETTLQHDLADIEQIGAILADLCQRVVARVEEKGVRPQTVTVKIRYADFQTVSRSFTFGSDKPAVAADFTAINDLALRLLRQTEAGSRPVRLVGVTLSNFRTENTPQTDGQLLLFADNEEFHCENR